MTRWFLIVIALSACAAEDGSAFGASDTEYIGDDIPAGNCGETDNDPCTSSSGDATPSNCEASSDCQGGSVCAAGFDGEIGSFGCRASCIEDLDETRWCIDDEGCCGVDSICQGRGYCLPSTSVDATTTDADAGTSTAGDATGTTSATSSTSTGA